MMMTIKQLADLAGVTVRTLQYYDQKGLLKPVKRSRNGYRYYDVDAVMRLQQILFFRELDFSLDDIKTILSRSDFNHLDALRQQRTLLEKKKERINGLLETLNRTIECKSSESDMDIRDYYRGFSDEKIEQYRKEVRTRWGDKVLEESETRVSEIDKDRFIEVQAEGGRIFKTIYTNMEKGYKSEFIQEQIAVWRTWLEYFHHYTDEEVLGLGEAYSQSRDFALFFDQYHRDLPEFLTKAIRYYVTKKKRKKIR